MVGTRRRIRESLLVYSVQYLHHPTLDDLVLQRCDTEWALSSIWFWYVYPTRRACPLGTVVDPLKKILEVLPQILFVGVPCHVIDFMAQPSG
ncbi:hypothetical protein AXFE_01730 [Acidithrix ferrooxidans]|uniref:Uncharacterized protein n=1 Tax=Acidithrix ferrooxidans TaxID=1280514 RepID=A0A0D8HMD0_9ACTN|nr:hypothetical protein AXFE_36700 [Acidithrix ferrooxidans]KJF18157.1 hypothetical protein AXFE_09020 [Acidithrix ferrooxidans]KJF18887.1 hypothetical protein AXFE_01730 [Acidithrix ferrooxidans]